MPASAEYLGVIVATTTKNNHDTATPFSNTGDALKGKLLLVQSDVACYILGGIANTATVTSTNGVRIEANERVPFRMRRDQGWLACLPTTGTANLRVWELR